MNGSAPHREVLRATLRSESDAERFDSAHRFLRSQLISTRDTAIGRDFFFAAKAAGVSGALRDLVEIEHEHGKDLHFDYAELEGYFLLRIAGTPAQRADIDTYFG
jgi:hypothetical protein